MPYGIIELLRPITFLIYCLLGNACPLGVSTPFFKNMFDVAQDAPKPVTSSNDTMARPGIPPLHNIGIKLRVRRPISPASSQASAEDTAFHGFRVSQKMPMLVVVHQ
jgi:hypothetical protein